MIMERLPPELLHYVFSLISPIGMKEVALVCKNWSFLARPYIYHTIKLQSIKQTKNFITTLKYSNENNTPRHRHSKTDNNNVITIPPFVQLPIGHYVKRIQIADELNNKMTEQQFISIQYLCPFIEYIDPHYKHYMNRLPLWFQMKHLKLPIYDHPHKIQLIQEWCQSRGSQLTHLITTVEHSFCKIMVHPINNSSSSFTTTTFMNEFTFKVLTIPHQYEHLYMLELSNTFNRTSSSILPLGCYLLKIIHDSCPRLNTLKISSKYLLTNAIFTNDRYKFNQQVFNNNNNDYNTIATTTTSTTKDKYKYIDDYNMMILNKTPPKFGHHLKHLSFFIHPFITTDIFKFFTLMYPMIDTLSLHFQLKSMDQQLIPLTPELIDMIDTMSQHVYELITEGFQHLNTLNINLATRNYLHNKLWPHDRIIEWLDQLYDTNNNDQLNINHSNKKRKKQLQQHQQEESLKKNQIRNFHFHIENDFNGAYNETFNIGNGNWFETLNEFTVDAHMMLSKTTLHTLFHGKKKSQFLYMTHLTLTNSVDKKIVLVIPLFVCPTLQSLIIHNASFKPRFSRQPRLLHGMRHHPLKRLELKHCSILDVATFERTLNICHQLTHLIGQCLLFEDEIEFPLHQRLTSVIGNYYTYLTKPKYTFQQYMEAQPIIHLHLSHPYLAYVSFSSISYFSTLTQNRVCSISILLVDQFSHHDLNVSSSTTSSTSSSSQQQQQQQQLDSSVVMASNNNNDMTSMDIDNHPQHPIVLNENENENDHHAPSIVAVAIGAVRDFFNMNDNHDNHQVNNNINNVNNNNHHVNNNSNPMNNNNSYLNNNNNHINNNNSHINNNNNNMNHQHIIHQNNNKHNGNDDDPNRLISNLPGIKIYGTETGTQLRKNGRLIQSPRSYIKLTCKHIDEMIWD